MALSKLSSNQSSTSNKAVKKVTVFHRTEFERTIFDDTTLFFYSSRIKGDYKYDVDMDVVPNIILEYLSTPYAQELLERSLNNLISLTENKLPEEFKPSHWEEIGSHIISSLSLGCHLGLPLTPDYQITFAHIMSQFITDELWDKLISEAAIIPEIIKKEDVKRDEVINTHYIRCLLETDSSPTELVFHYPNNPKKVLNKMVELYRTYFDIEHLDIEAHILAVVRCLLLAIVQAILDYESPNF